MTAGELMRPSAFQPINANFGLLPAPTFEVKDRQERNRFHAERAGAHLVKRTYSEPRWSKRAASVMEQMAETSTTRKTVSSSVSIAVLAGTMSPAVKKFWNMKCSLEKGERQCLPILTRKRWQGQKK